MVVNEEPRSSYGTAAAFDDLFTFVHDPTTLLVAFSRVAGNRGANTPGVDGLTAASDGAAIGVLGFLDC